MVQLKLCINVIQDYHQFKTTQIITKPCRYLVYFDSEKTFGALSNYLENRLFGCLTTHNKFIEYQINYDIYENSFEQTLNELGIRKQDHIYEVLVYMPHIFLSPLILKDY